MRWYFVGVLACLLNISPAFAANRYVSPTGSDGNAANCATLTNRTTPAQHIAAGLGCASSGDTVMLLNGTYTNEFMSGTMIGAGVTIKAENRYGAVLQYTNTCSNVFPFEINNANIRIDGIVSDATAVTCGLTQHIRIGPNGNTFTLENSELKGGHNTQAASNSHGIGFTGSGIESVNQGATFRNNKIHDIGMDAPGDTGTQSYCIYAASSGILFENNECYNIGGRVVHMFCNVSTGDTDVCHNNIFRNNYFHDSFDGFMFACGGRDNQLYNNIIARAPVTGSGHPAIQVGGQGDGASTGNKVWNNTVYNNRSVCIQLGSSGLTTGAIVQNNICYQNNTDSVVISNSTGHTVSNNLLGTNPQFVVASPTLIADFALQSTSPARDTGTSAGLIGSTVTMDIVGSVRPQPAGGAWDLGAVEFTTVAIPTTPSIWWKFDEGTGTTAADSSTANMPGTLQGGPAWGPGRSGPSSLTFNGTTQWVQSTAFTWAVSQAVTVQFWLKASACTQAGCGLFGVGASPTPNRFGAEIWTDNVFYWDYGTCCGAGTNRVSLSFTSYFGQWVHVVLVSDTVGFQGIYINGSLAASISTAGAPNIPLAGLDVGRRQTSEILYQAAQIDNFRMENRAWSAVEILTEYRRAAAIPRHGGNIGLR